MRVALLSKTFMNWGGGIDLLRNLASALASAGESHRIEVKVLVPVRGRFKGPFRDFITSLKQITNGILSLRRPRDFSSHLIDEKSFVDCFGSIDGVIQVIYYDDGHDSLRSCLKNAEIDVVLPTITSLGGAFPIPWIGYICDFQHKYLHQNFGCIERFLRDRMFTQLVKEAGAILVNSKAVKEDVQKFLPNHRCQIFNLPFSPIPLDSWFEDRVELCRSKYSLPERYFIVSNQFWIHKSHITAFAALSKLTLQPGMEDVHIVCTGKTEDYRRPSFFKELNRIAGELSVLPKIHCIGYIPKTDQVQIMKGAVAVLQPSMFEGGPGGGAIHDAVALGVPAIVSDILVNLEIEDKNVFFFRAGSSDEMAERMSEVLSEEIVRPERDVLVARGRARANKLAMTLLEAIDVVLSEQQREFRAGHV